MQSWWEWDFFQKYKILPTLIFWTVVWLIELFVVYLKTGSVHLSLSVCPGRAMRHLVFLLPALLLLLALPDTRGRYNDDFDDGEDIAEFDDNDFAEFEDVSEDPAVDVEKEPPPRAAPSSTPIEDDEDEATVENEDGQDEFEDADAQVKMWKHSYFCFSASHS